MTADALKAFLAVTAVSCGEEPRQLAGAGEWLVDVRKVAVDGVAGVQAAFELPSQPLGSPPAGAPPGAVISCTADLVGTPPVILVDAAGRTLTPVAPQTSCGKPLPQLISALGAVTWREVSVHKMRQLVTPQAQAAHCEMQWKNENWIAAEMHGRRSAGGPAFYGTTPTALHVCIYRVTGRDLEVGSFSRAVDLAGAAATSLARALTGPGPTATCPVQREFAVVQTPAGGWANVELGGCWRVARNNPNFATGSADAATVSHLLAR